ncbi:MAG TPA: FeoA family protein [Caulobacteraceae bacterium]|nr:FeoA family protein [Caulobacteraceae bacterium]
MSEFDLQSGGEPAVEAGAAPLSSGRKGFSGVIVAVQAMRQAGGTAGGLDGAEIERRLIEMGFVEDAPVEIVHEGLIGRDPIAIRLADRTVALRRREARAVLVRPKGALLAAE